MKQKKFCLLAILIVAVLLSFVLGFIAGKHSKIKKRYKNQDVVKFYQNNKYLAKELNEEEKDGVTSFIIPYEDCLVKKLNQVEREKVTEIQKEVLELSKNNNKVKFRFKDLKSAQNEQNLIKKVKKCKKQAYKHMKQNDRKLFKNALKKMRIIDIISIFHGIK